MQTITSQTWRSIGICWSRFRRSFCSARTSGCTQRTPNIALHCEWTRLLMHSVLMTATFAARPFATQFHPQPIAYIEGWSSYTHRYQRSGSLLNSIYSCLFTQVAFQLSRKQYENLHALERRLRAGKQVSQLVPGSGFPLAPHRSTITISDNATSRSVRHVPSTRLHGPGRTRGTADPTGDVVALRIPMCEYNSDRWAGYAAKK